MLQIEYVPPGRLQPYERNPREHSAEQIDKIAASISEFGWSSPIIVDDNFGIIAGHGRHLAAQALGMKTVPVVQLKNLTEQQRRALVIAENQLALAATWNEGFLGIELNELQAGGLDLGLLGFDAIELGKLLAPDGGQPAEQPERELSEEEQQRLNAAWRKLLPEWKAAVDNALRNRFVSTNYTRGALAVHFIRAQLYGHDIPRNATLPYQLHRLTVTGDCYPFNKLFDAAMREDNKLKSLQFGVGGKPSLDTALGALSIQGHRMPQEFPAALARDLINEFSTEGGRILDPCHGWGGRLLGFLLSKASEYHGFDTDPKTYGGVQDIFADLHEFAPDKRMKTYMLPFEQAKLKANHYDFALTSPPYFNVEKYGGTESSWRRYPKLEEWVQGFYRPLIEKTAKALKPGKVFALQVGSQRYPLEKLAVEIAIELGLSHVATRATDMHNHQQQTPEDIGEVIVLLRKAGGDAALQFGEVLN